MLFFLLALALLQIFLLPGLFITSRLVLLPRLDRILLAVPLSFLINHLIVIALVLSGFYTQTAVLIIFGLECLVLGPILFSSFRNKDPKLFHFHSLNWLVVAIVMFALFKLGIFGLWSRQLFTTFQDWDAIVSWHRWTLAWYQGAFPTGFWTYPQIVPTMQSLTYKFIGTSEVTLASKFFAIVVFPLIPLTAFRLACFFPRHIQNEILLALPIFYYLTPIMVYPEYMFTGGPDMTIVFFGILGAYCFALSQPLFSEKLDFQKAKTLFILGLISATSFIIKQAGVFVSAFYPTAILWFRRDVSYKFRLRFFVLMALLALALAVPWYSYVLFSTKSIMQDAYLVYDNVIRTPMHLRPLRGAKMLFEQWGLWPVLFLFVGLIQKRNRFLFVPLILIFFAWALYVSYDTRNLFVSLPYFYILMASGFLFVCRFIFGNLDKAVGQRLSQPFVILSHQTKSLLKGLKKSTIFTGKRFISSILVLLAMSLLILKSKVNLPEDTYNWGIERSIREQLKIEGAVYLNSYLYDEFRPKYSGTGIQIATDYQIMMHLPKMREFYHDTGFLSGLEIFSQLFLAKSTHYILLSPYAGKDVVQYLEKMESTGEFKKIFEGNGYRFFKILYLNKKCSYFRQLNPHSASECSLHSEKSAQPGN